MTEPKVATIRSAVKMVRQLYLSALWHPANFPGCDLAKLQSADPAFRVACDIDRPEYASGHSEAYLFWNPDLSKDGYGK